MQISYVPVILVIKLSLFLLYLRVFHPYKWMVYCVWVGIVLNIGFYTTYAIYVGVLCSPAPGKNWNDLLVAQFIGENRCASTIQFALIQSGVSIASDFYLLLLPIPAVWQLGLQPRKFIGVVSIFATGLL